MHKGDVLNHLDKFKNGYFVEADFCGKISTYKKFFKNLPQYWSLTVCTIRCGNFNKIVNMFGEMMGGKVKMGRTTVKQDANGGEFEYTKISVNNKPYHVYYYGDPNPATRKCSKMVVFTNV